MPHRIKALSGTQYTGDGDGDGDGEGNGDDTGDGNRDGTGETNTGDDIGDDIRKDTVSYSSYSVAQSRLPYAASTTYNRVATPVMLRVP
ncbi:hypothetical protein G7Z17_g3736 [Cylindrodendrum hubeiense]|uniref:Uncharacterized protein n=1 Tax=Cylindrodendrum hubeiense TaxID=595255 RepID=A0A9P5LDA7_9HYPO|nr:hypothetical protein G7Z17_g3736 [Cylindrodendrum hubeiense]